MKLKYNIMYLLLAVLFGACSDDEPETPGGEYPVKTEFERIVKGKTWKASEVKYIDSRGHSFDWCGIAGGYTYQPSGFLLRDDDCLYAAYYYMANQRRHLLKWTYDETSGMLYLYSTAPNEDNGCFIESLSEDRIVVRKDFGILPEWFYEMENGLDYDYESSGRDEDSYARCVYEPVAEEDEDAYWAQYPVIDGPIYGVPHASK